MGGGENEWKKMFYLDRPRTRARGNGSFSVFPVYDKLQVECIGIIMLVYIIIRYNILFYSENWFKRKKKSLSKNFSDTTELSNVALNMVIDSG